MTLINIITDLEIFVYIKYRTYICRISYKLLSSQFSQPKNFCDELEIERRFCLFLLQLKQDTNAMPNNRNGGSCEHRKCSRMLSFGLVPEHLYGKLSILYQTTRTINRHTRVCSSLSLWLNTRIAIDSPRCLEESV